MIKDPVVALQGTVRAYLQARGASDVTSDVAPGPGVRWGAHLFEPKTKRAWYCLTDLPESDAWARRIQQAVSALPGLSIGLCGPMNVLQDEATLEAADSLEAQVLVAKEESASYSVTEDDHHPTVCELIYEGSLQLTPRVARIVLDRNLQRAVDEPNIQRKGVRLEVVTAVMLSQVQGFEVASVGISNRSQQIDVTVHNRNTGGVLRRGSLVLAEAKNWSNPVGTVEYYSLLRKIQARHGFAKMGFFVTTDRFTEGVDLEARRDSMGDTLVVTLDGETLPVIWRKGQSITANIEAAIIRATVGH